MHHRDTEITEEIRIAGVPPEAGGPIVTGV
jgi:hypothetical protein